MARNSFITGYSTSEHIGHTKQGALNYLDVPNDNTTINTRGHKLSGICFSSTVDLHLTEKKREQRNINILLIIYNELFNANTNS